MRYSPSVLIISIISGLVGAGLAALLYFCALDALGRPLTIGLMIALIAIVICVTLFITLRIKDQSDDQCFFLDGKGKLIIALAVLLAVLTPLSMLLEWLYDMDAEVAAPATSYIFLLDESGSMGSNDPNRERHDAVNTVMQTMPASTPYAVYAFADDCGRLRDMAPYSQGSFTPNYAYGAFGSSTYIRRALQTVLDDFNAGQLPNTGAAPRVVLLTDGVASDISGYSGIRDLLDQYNNAGISISTVGLGSADTYTLRNIARSTGGGYVRAANAKALASSFSSVALTDGSRDLFSERTGNESTLLYLLLRILFLTVIAAVIGLMKALAVAKEDSTWPIILATLINGAVGAVLVEVLALVYAPAWIGMLLYGALVALTPVEKPARRPDYGNIPMAF